jgi:hypothetical protein
VSTVAGAPFADWIAMPAQEKLLRVYIVHLGRSAFNAHRSDRSCADSCYFGQTAIVQTDADLNSIATREHWFRTLAHPKAPLCPSS